MKIDTSRLLVLSYKGKDGCEYPTSEACIEANRAFLVRTTELKGDDGRIYSSAEALQEAHNRYWEKQKILSKELSLK